MAEFNLFNVPEYYTGLLGQEQTDKLKRQALGTGITNALLAFIAQPRTEGFGSALPYLGRALMAGQQAGQEVVAGGLKDWETRQKIEELARQKKAREQFDVAAKGLYKTIPAQMETVTTPGGYAPAQTDIQAGQVAPNFGMTRLPDVTTQREIAPARQVLNEEALQQLMLSGDPRANQYLTGLKTLKDITKVEKGESPFAKVEPNKFTRESLIKFNATGNYADLEPIAEKEKATTKQQDYQFYAKQETDAGRTPKSFAEWDMSIESARAPKSTSIVNMPPAAKAVLAADEETIKGLTANANSARSVAAQTRNINSLIGSRQGSGLIKLSADAQNFLGVKSQDANVNQAVQALATKAATEIRTPGSGSTSDLEFSAYRSAFPSLATSNEGRQLMAKIAEANAIRMSKLADYARKNVINNTFTYEGLAAYDNSLGQAVSDDIRKRVEALSGTQTSAKGWSVREKQ